MQEESRFDELLHGTAEAIELAGVAIIVLGALFALATAISAWRGGSGPEAYHIFRTRLGRSILLGLELLVAADIIGTVAVEPTFENLAVLGLIVLIRTFLSISLDVEIDGRWPWRKGAAENRSPSE